MARRRLKGLGSDNGDLWGAGLDVQFNLIPAERFNLWVGLGGTYIPEQDFADFAYSEGDAYYSYSEDYKARIRSYGMRVMAVPEWKVCDAFALGLRLGVSLEHFPVTTPSLTRITWCRALWVCRPRGTSPNISVSSRMWMGGLAATWI